MSKEILAGQRFGMLTTKTRYDSGRGHERWLCQCDCGKTKLVLGWRLRLGKMTSCGCTAAQKEYVPIKYRKFQRSVHMPFEYKIKYGCDVCTDRKKCLEFYNLEGKVICKYADILDKCENYAKYDKEMAEKIRHFFTDDEVFFYDKD